MKDPPMSASHLTETADHAQALGRHFHIRTIDGLLPGKTAHSSHDWLVFADNADEASTKLKDIISNNDSGDPVYYGTPIPLQGDCFSIGGAGSFDRDLVALMIRQQKDKPAESSPISAEPAERRATGRASVVPSDEAREETAKQLFREFPHFLERERQYEGLSWDQLSPRGRKPFYAIADFFGARWKRV
jgi:hypothetical protein